jgi:ribonuclease BN (tRNA processing enzyme)
MSKPNLRLKIYGARGSYSPTNGNATSVGVNTTCFRVDIGGNIIIFDAGSGIINCGQDLFREMQTERASLNEWKIHLFFTHLHLDHLVGLPFFSLLYMPKSKIHFIGPQILDYEVEETLRTFMHPPFFPVGMDDLPFEGAFHKIREGKVVYFYEKEFRIRSVNDPVADGWSGKISTLRNYMHPKGGSYFYKIEIPSGKSIVIATDTEGFVGGDQRLIKFAGGADLLLHDAQYEPQDYGMMQGFGHSTYEMACDVAEKAVKKLLLVHHDPRYEDEKLQKLESSARKLFPETHIAAEAMEFSF